MNYSMLLALLALLFFKLNKKLDNSRRELIEANVIPIYNVVCADYCCLKFVEISLSVKCSPFDPTEMAGWILLNLQFYRDQPITT